MKTYADLSEDGGANVLGQVIAQRSEIHQNLSSVKHIIGIGSGKGGVGKSTLSMLFALALRSLGKSVALLDADLNGPSIGRIAGVMNATFVPGDNGIELPVTKDGLGVFSLGSILPETQSLEFYSVAHGDSFTWRETKEFTSLAEILAGVNWGTRDFLLLDLPPGPEKTFHFAEFLGSQLSLVIVCNPSDLARGVVNRGIRAIEKSQSRMLGYVSNMDGYYCSESDSIKPLFPKSEKDLPIPCLGSIPFDPVLANLCDSGVTLSACRESFAFSEIVRSAETISKLIEEKA